ncbi:unnamed protein product [Parnassius mnemosyne]|uniref:THAP-type domain-containing protein n=1 Tax=Parnassius mnemosyne TaxID=213953 RepID=A0AAV1M3W0_9NEOP
MSCCSIRWCGKNSKTSNYKTDGITFHRFAKDPNLKEQWIDCAKRETGFQVIIVSFAPDILQKIVFIHQKVAAVCLIPQFLH